MKTVAAVRRLLAASLCSPRPRAPPRRRVFLEDMTWTEVRDAIAAGRTTVIVPVGGTEQSGPHMALGKHNVRAHVLAGRIATQLGNALVAPVVAYVPEGDDRRRERPHPLRRHDLGDPRRRSRACSKARRAAFAAPAFATSC